MFTGLGESEEEVFDFRVCMLVFWAGMVVLLPYGVVQSMPTRVKKL